MGEVKRVGQGVLVNAVVREGDGGEEGVVVEI